MTSHADGERFRLRGSVEAVTGRDGAMFLVRSGDADLVVRDASETDRVLLELLSQGEPSVEDLAAALQLAPDEVQRKLADLSAAGVLTRARHRRRWRTTTRSASHASSRTWPSSVTSVKPSAAWRGPLVTVIGCGGLGTWALAALAAAGLRHFRLVDDDRVELSNLNRQVLYTPAEIGTLESCRGTRLADGLRPSGERSGDRPPRRRPGGCRSGRRRLDRCRFSSRTHRPMNSLDGSTGRA